MQRIKRIGAAVFMAIALLALPTMTGVANAATQVPNNPYTPEDICNERWPGGYRVVDQMTLAGGKAVSYLLRATDTEACAVTMKRGDAVGDSTTVSIWIEAIGGPDGFPDNDMNIDKGDYQYYAGPVVFYHWPCVHWGGRYGDDTVKKTPCD